MREITRSGMKFNIREETLDEWIVDEVLSPNDYLIPLMITAKDTVLDIGMNIGVLSVWAGSRGAKVIGYEPEKENFDISVSNMNINGFKGELFQKGVSDEDKVVSLYLNNKKNRGQHTTTFVGGRPSVDIECVGINSILEQYKPNKIKMDCEGEEYKIILAVKNWYDTEVLVFEWHRSVLRDKNNVMFHEVWDKLEKDFEIKGKKDGKGFTAIIKCKRKHV